MKSPSPSLIRAERLIAICRVVLAACTLLVVLLDPSQPAKYASTAYALLATYVVYALLVAFLVWGSDAPLGRQDVIMHAFDLAAFSLFMYFTEGPTGPFFLYFIFLLLVATLRWQWRGTLWTAVAGLATFVGMGAYAADVLHDPAFGLVPFIIRGVYLAVVAILVGYLVGYLGAREQRVSSETSMLAAWPRAFPREAQTLVSEVLEHAAGILRSPRVLLAWQVEEDPRSHLAFWPHGELHWTRDTPATFQPLVAEPLA